MTAWMRSTGHRENILRTEFATMGVGCYIDNTGTLNWVQLFMENQPINTNLSGCTGTKNVTNKVEVAAKNIVPNIKISNSYSNIYVGDTRDLYTALKNVGWESGYIYAENAEVTYTVQDSTICKITNGSNSYSKKITFLKEGTTNIIATVKGQKSVYPITVNKKTIPLQGIELDKQELTLEEDATYKLKVTYKPTDTTADRTASWRSLNESVAVVDKNGTVKAIKSGGTYIVAEVGGYRRYCYVKVTPWNKFVDVNSGNWFYDSVKYTSKNNIILGVDSTHFAPYNKLTRGMLVTILWRMEGEPAITANKFTDVKSGKYYYSAVNWASSKGIVHGYGNGKFGPNDNITREQLCAILMNYANYKKKNTTVRANMGKYSDYNKTSSYFKDSVSWCVAKKIITGKDNGTKIDPKGNTSRAEAAAMLMNYCMYVK